MNDLSRVNLAQKSPPVLFLTFTRIDTARQVFDAIRQAKPSRLYLASDGPRSTHPEDTEKIQQVREQIVAGVDWPCEIKTLFRMQNLGCAMGVSTAITWFFEQEEFGIILEDDCLPSQDFFKLCEELLPKYSKNASIAAISGTNTLDNMDTGNCSYFYSLLGGNWGWASWRREWQNYKLDIDNDFTKKCVNKISQNLGNKKEAIALVKEMRTALNNPKISAWDYQWLFYRVLHNKVSIVPEKNLISNIGFGKESTHTGDIEHPLAKLPVGTIKWPLRHPNSIIANRQFDSACLQLRDSNTPIYSKVFTYLKRKFGGYVP